MQVWRHGILKAPVYIQCFCCVCYVRSVFPNLDLTMEVNGLTAKETALKKCLAKLRGQWMCWGPRGTRERCIGVSSDIPAGHPVILSMFTPWLTCHWWRVPSQTLYIAVSERWTETSAYSTNNHSFCRRRNPLQKLTTCLSRSGLWCKAFVFQVFSRISCKLSDDLLLN